MHQLKEITAQVGGWTLFGYGVALGSYLSIGASVLLAVAGLWAAANHSVANRLRREELALARARFLADRREP